VVAAFTVTVVWAMVASGNSDRAAIRKIDLEMFIKMSNESVPYELQPRPPEKKKAGFDPALAELYLETVEKIPGTGFQGQKRPCNSLDPKDFRRKSWGYLGCR
jgi:hypothetical protein